MLFELLHAKPCKIIGKLYKKVSFDPKRAKLNQHISFKYIFTKNVVSGLQRAFYDSFNVLLNFLAEK